MIIVCYLLILAFDKMVDFALGSCSRIYLGISLHIQDAVILFKWSSDLQLVNGFSPEKYFTTTQTCRKRTNLTKVKKQEQQLKFFFYDCFHNTSSLSIISLFLNMKIRTLDTRLHRSQKTKD